MNGVDIFNKAVEQEIECLKSNKANHYVPALVAAADKVGQAMVEGDFDLPRRDDIDAASSDITSQGDAGLVRSTLREIADDMKLNTLG